MTICAALQISRATAYRVPVARGPTYAKPADPVVIAQVRSILREPHRGAVGYRMATTLVNGRFGTGYNKKRLQRVMRRYGLGGPRHQRPRRTRPHTGQVQRPVSNERWCSDACAIACANGAVVWVAFVLDCHDRECLAWVAAPRALVATDVQQLMTQAVAQRFDGQRPPARLEWLSDNGSPYTAWATVLHAERLGLTPLTTPAASPESNGMAEAFVRTLRRDYLEEADLRSPDTVLPQLPRWITDYNTARPHSALGYLPPTRYREQEGERQTPECLMNWGAEQRSCEETEQPVEYGFKWL
ncbi:MAG: IS3 family transposase [Gemmatimonadales bacterium]